LASLSSADTRAEAWETTTIWERFEAAAIRRASGASSSGCRLVRNRLGSGPQGGLQAAFLGKGLDDPALGDLRQKLQRPIETGLAAAIGAGDDGEFAERQSDIAQRSIAGDGKSRHHDRLLFSPHRPANSLHRERKGTAWQLAKVRGRIPKRR
jgi:hypothetical protein